MKHDELVVVSMVCLITYATGSIASFMHAREQMIEPEGTVRPPPEVIAVWQVLRALVWPVRVSWYVVLAVWISLRSCLSFLRWAALRPQSVPKARVVSR